MCYQSDKKITLLADVVLWIAFLAGFILSVMSALKICSEICSESAKYLFFGFDFGLFGCLFFSFLIILLAFRGKFYIADILIRCTVFAALGAELRFIWIQKYVIGAWCPLCLGVAATILMASLVMLYKLAITKVTKSGGIMKNKLFQYILITVMTMLGLGISMIGVEKEVEASEANIYLGKHSSNTTVYIISDWFCPGCRKIEPEIEKVFPEISATVKVAFVDMPVHKESSNFTPYNLQFMTYEKPKYIKLRHILDEISRTTKSPTEAQVQSAVARLGVILKPPNYVEIMNGFKYFESIYRDFGVKSTPTVIVENRKTKKKKVMVGSNDINKNTIKAAIEEVSK